MVERGEASMRLHVTARHVEVSKEVREYIEEKAGKLPRFYDRIHEIEVILDHESEQFSAEMIVRTDRKNTFVASETGADTFALIDTIVGRIERQLIKHKERHRNHKHDGKTNVTDEA